jgi:hypothetical protein
VALTDDQKAMLRLLAQREEGYAEMAALMGISVEEVRVKVKEALAEVDQAGVASEGVAAPPSEPPPVPESPTAPPEAEQPPPPAPEPPAPTPRDEPSPASAPRPAPAKAAEPSPGRRPRLKAPAASAGLKLPKDRGALIGLGAGVVAVLVLVIVLIVGGGGSDSDSGATATSGGGEATTAPTSNSNLTEAILVPTDGGDASGRALFGRFKKNVLLQVEANGLSPAPAGQSYTVWLYRSPKIALRVGSVPERSGKIAAQLPIPAQLLAYVANGAFDQIDLSLTSDAGYKAALTKAKSEKTLPPYIGESVLRGEIIGPAIKKQ